jgi:hypothetical protein
MLDSPFLGFGCNLKLEQQQDTDTTYLIVSCTIQGHKGGKAIVDGSHTMHICLFHNLYK